MHNVMIMVLAVAAMVLAAMVVLVATVAAATVAMVLAVTVAMVVVVLAATVAMVLAVMTRTCRSYLRSYHQHQVPQMFYNKTNLMKDSEEQWMYLYFNCPDKFPRIPT